MIFFSKFLSIQFFKFSKNLRFLEVHPKIFEVHKIWMIRRNHLRSIVHIYMIFNTDFDGSFKGMGIFEEIKQLLNQLGNRFIIFRSTIIYSL